VLYFIDIFQGLTLIFDKEYYMKNSLHFFDGKEILPIYLLVSFILIHKKGACYCALSFLWERINEQL